MLLQIVVWLLIFNVHYIRIIYFEYWNTYIIKSDTEEEPKAIGNENKLELENEDGRRNLFCMQFYATSPHFIKDG